MCGAVTEVRPLIVMTKDTEVAQTMLILNCIWIAYVLSKKTVVSFKARINSRVWEGFLQTGRW